MPYLILIFLALSACIQLPIENSKSVVYQKIHYQSPRPNYKQVIGIKADKAWLNKKNSNLISYRSECPSQVLELSNYLSSLKSSFPNAEILEANSRSFNSRRAYRVKFSAPVEGVENHFDLLAVNKYGCFFLLSHTAVASEFKKGEPDFANFIESFKIIK